MSVLDDPAFRDRLDPQGMLATIRGLPQQCRTAWAQARGTDFGDLSGIRRVLILGMGGSAIGGDMLRQLLQRESSVPVFNCRQYELPPYVDEGTLLIASSFSGNTEETLSAFQQGLATTAKKVAVTSGGRLLATARANGVPAFVFQFQGEPRSALGYSLMPLLAVAEKAGLMQGVARDVEEALSGMERLQEETGEDVPSERNPAKQLAQKFQGRLPVIYGAGVLTEVAHRWKTQLNESSKVWCFYEELPEANHNAIVGYGLPEEIAQRAFVVFLRSAKLQPRVLLRYEFTQRALREAGVEYEVVDTRGESDLAQMLTGVLFGDYVSYYLALLNGVAPAPTTVIDELKAWLAERGDDEQHI